MKARLSRSLAFALGAILLALAALAPAGAQRAPTVRPYDRLHYIGQVTNVVGSSTIPDSFSLELGNRSIDLHTLPRTIVKANSAEAEVEGLVNGDYALVTARRIRKVWMAIRIVYDVRPFGPLRLFSGYVLRVSPDGMRLMLKLDNGRNLFVRLARDAHYRLNGRLLGAPPVFVRGQQVQILALHDVQWVGYEIDVYPAYYGIHIFR